MATPPDAMTALIQTTVSTLRTALSLETGTCDEQPAGKPEPDAGQVYYAVHQGDWTEKGDCIDGLSETYGLNVTITLRTGYVPADRLKNQIYPQMRQMAAQVRVQLHLNWTHFRAVNAALGDTVQGFATALRFKRIEPPRPVGPDWFFADAEEDDAMTGVAITVVFGDMERIQDPNLGALQ